MQISFYIDWDEPDYMQQEAALVGEWKKFDLIGSKIVGVRFDDDGRMILTVEREEETKPKVHCVSCS